MNKRTDKPLCPYCKSDLALFASTGQVSDRPVQGLEDPKYTLEQVSLYCSSAECTGRSLTGHETGYDIKVKDI